MVCPGPSFIPKDCLKVSLGMCRKLASFEELTRSQAIFCYLCICLEIYQVEQSQERICGEPDPLVSSPTVAFKFPFVLKCFHTELASKAGYFRSTYLILDYFYVFIKCMSKAGQFRSTYLILGCSLFFICLNFPSYYFISFHKSNFKEIIRHR